MSVPLVEMVDRQLESRNVHYYNLPHQACSYSVFANKDGEAIHTSENSTGTTQVTKIIRDRYPRDLKN